MNAGAGRTVAAGDRAAVHAGTGARAGLPRPGALDLVLGGVLTALMLGELLAERQVGTVVHAPALVAALLLAMGLAVALRNVLPFTAFLVNGLALVGVIALGFHGFVYRWTNVVSLYSVAERCPPPLSFLALVFGELGVVAWFALAREPALPLVQLFVMLLWVAGWLAGTQVATRRRELDRRRSVAAQAEARRTAEVRATVAEERAQMARELHDAIGHSVTLMVMQAGAARRSIDRDAAAAVRAIGIVERVGREALGELDRLLGLLRRQQDGDAATGAAPGLDDLPALVERATAGGLQVTLDLDADGAGMSQAVQLGVFRVVQEALTNTLKHARAGRAQVAVQSRGDRVVAEVTDDGHGSSGGDAPRRGQGLIGLAARVDALGGTLTHGPRPQGGYRVTCEIPLP